MGDNHLVEAKQEYTAYLVSILEPSIYNGFKDIYEQSKKITNGNSVYKNYQILLSNVPNWNHYMLEKEVNDIIKETSCDWLDNLITAVFVSYSKILTSVKVGNYRPRATKIDLKIPDTANFIHQCYLEASRTFFKNPFLFLDDPKIIKPEDYLKNNETVKRIIRESIMTTVRKMLPFKNILNEYLSLENNTLAIGGPSMASILPATQEQEGAAYNSNSDSESEKEVAIKGKEMNLDDLSIAKQDIDESINSKTVEQVVKSIKNEYVKKGGDLDNLSIDLKEELNDVKLDEKEEEDEKEDEHDDFFENVQARKSSDDDSETTMDKLNSILSGEKEEELPRVKKSVGGQQQQEVKQDKESIDLENLRKSVKEEGTISNLKVPERINEIKNIDPIQREGSSDIKKISIKYSSGIPLGKKKSNNKRRTTLIDEAADDDSSEMAF
jgi:hypothetical protein